MKSGGKPKGFGRKKCKTHNYNSKN
jgi:hypothetical protein